METAFSTSSAPGGQACWVAPSPASAQPLDERLDAREQFTLERDRAWV